MFRAGKLKPDRSMGGWIVSLSILPIFGLSALIFGAATGFIVAAFMFVIFALYTLYIFIRMGNLGHLGVCAYLLFIATMLMLATQYLTGVRDAREEWKIAYFTGMIFFGVLIIYLAVTKKIKWRGREIFELAAESVDETGNGYTPRPRPVGIVEFTADEILDFARFCARHLIAVTYINPRKVTFVPIRMGQEFTFMFKSADSWQERTWISFDFDGEVTVHIAQKDYLEYREPLAFDKLCESLGQLFIEFIEHHQRGEGVRIIDRMDALGMSYFS